jgi:outer membrane receptor protein involved in Fe transport
VQFFVNAFNGDAPALLQRDGNGDVLGFTVRNLASDIEFSNGHILGTQHLLSYGGNYRHNAFDLSLAPAGDNRDEGGFYVQDEIFLSDHFRWVVGTRVDQFDVLDKTVFSPRTTFMFKPQSDQTFRVSFNRAFRAPSFVNSFLEADFLVAPGISAPAVGNLDLNEEALTAYEAGYIGVLGPATVSGAVYFNHTDDTILFTQSETSPSGVPLQFTYLNFPRVTEKGIELSVDWEIHDAVSTFVNYSWQGRPEAPSIDPGELNVPPRHRFNAGMRFGRGRYFGDLSTSYVDAAFWQDVLTTPFHGSTDAYTLVNGGFGVRSTDERLIVSVQSTNLFNAEVQQHVFGDLIKRSVTVEVHVRF